MFYNSNCCAGENCKGKDCENCNRGKRCCFKKLLAIFLILLSIFMILEIIKVYKSNQFIGQGVVGNTMTFSGKGEVNAVPDIATFSYSVIEEAKTSSAAQSLAAEKINKTIQFLKDSKIADKDIKTTGYNISPKYEWRSGVVACLNCPPSNSTRVLVGYEASQTVTVKVRNIDKAGEILSGVGNFKVSDIGGLNFIVDDEEDLNREARKLAIEDAKNKAEILAKDLGVDLVRIVNFNESEGYPYPMVSKYSTMGIGGGVEDATVPQIPVGENKITSNINITYEIR